MGGNPSQKKTPVAQSFGIFENLTAGPYVLYYTSYRGKSYRISWISIINPYFGAYITGERLETVPECSKHVILSLGGVPSPSGGV